MHANQTSKSSELYSKKRRYRSLGNTCHSTNTVVCRSFAHTCNFLAVHFSIIFISMLLLWNIWTTVFGCLVVCFVGFLFIYFILFIIYLLLFSFGYMASDIWLRTILIVRKETRCRHIGYSYRLTARVLLYAPSHRQDSTYHGLCYTSRGSLTGTRNSSMGPPHEGSIRRPIAPWANALPLSYAPLPFSFGFKMKPVIISF